MKFTRDAAAAQCFASRFASGAYVHTCKCTGPITNRSRKFEERRRWKKQVKKQGERHTPTQAIRCDAIECDVAIKTFQRLRHRFREVRRALKFHRNSLIDWSSPFDLGFELTYLPASSPPVWRQLTRGGRPCCRCCLPIIELAVSPHKVYTRAGH